MDLLNPGLPTSYRKTLWCPNCSAKLGINEADLHCQRKFGSTQRDFDEVKGYRFYVRCPVANCRHDITVAGVPTFVQNQVMDKYRTEWNADDEKDRRVNRICVGIFLATIAVVALLIVCG